MAIDAKSRSGTKSAACRCLFGRPSPQENNATLTEFRRQMNQTLDDKTVEYNFDFRTGLPLDGRWQWQRVEDDDRRRTRSTETEPEVSPLRGENVVEAAADPVDSGTESSVSSDSESGVPLANSPADGAVSDDVTSGRRRTSRKRQSAMTDHYKHTKRPRHQRESKDATTTSSTSSSSSSSSSTSSSSLSTTTITAAASQ